MGIAKRCDRCGQYYERYYPEFTVIKYLGQRTATYRKNTSLDLCPDCTKELKTWIEIGDAYEGSKL